MATMLADAKTLAEMLEVLDSNTTPAGVTVAGQRELVARGWLAPRWVGTGVARREAVLELMGVRRSTEGLLVYRGLASVK